MICASTPRITSADGLIEVTLELDDFPVFVRWRGEIPPSPQAAGDAVLCFALIPAMAQGQNLRIDAPVSNQLLHQSTTVQDIILRWFPDRFQRIKVSCQAESERSPSPATGVASCFTGGIDSMFTMMRKQEELSHAIYVQGFDIKLKDTQHRELTSKNASAATTENGLQLIEVETNLRHYTDKFTNWLTDTHGSGLAGIGYLLSGQIGRLYIPSSNTYEALPFLGSDPLLDLQWRSQRLDVIHHGSDHDRIEKANAIADWPTAQKHLRVCGKNLPGQRNCGQCEKCARTLLIFEILGAYEAFVGNFSHPMPSAEAIAIDVPPDPGKWFDWEAMRRTSSEFDPSSTTTRGLEEKLRDYQNECLTRELRPHLSATIRSKYWHQRWQKFRKKILRSMAKSDPAWFSDRIKKNLPELRDALAAELKKDPHWLKKKVRKAAWRKRLGR